MSKLIIHGRLPSLNEYINACRTNKYAGASMKARLERAITSEIRASNINTYESPLSLYIDWYEPNNRRDIDNIIFAQKFILDALVSNGIIIDDSRKYIKQITHRVFTDKENPRIEVELKRIEDERE